MQKVFDREVIESFVMPSSQESVTSLVNFVENIFSQVLAKLKVKRPAISDNYFFEIVGEFENGSFSANSCLDLFIVIKSPQLELNTMKLINNKFKTFWNKLKFAYSSSKKEKKRKKKKKKVEQKEILVPVNKYSIADLKQDIINETLNLIDDKCFVCSNIYGFKLVVREYFGTDVNVYPVLKSGESYQIYNSFSNKFINIDFKNRSQNFLEKQNRVGEIFTLLLRVLNTLYFNIYNINPNQIVIESLLYSCPDELFDGVDFYQVFLKILNYLYNCNIEKIKCILDDESLFKNKLVEDSVVSINSFIRNVVKFLN